MAIIKLRRRIKMGDRYELVKSCAYCKSINDDIWFAPTCSSMTFKCKDCGKDNFITSDFEVKKIEDVCYDDIYGAINNASNMMSKEQIELSAKQYFQGLLCKLNKKKNKNLK